MKRIILGWVLCFLLAATAVAADSAAGWAKMQKLAGTWEGMWEGKPATITFQLTSAGSVLMQTDTTEGMVTMYHLGGDRLMMTHYCAAKNQPRMVAEVLTDGKTIQFRFLDITNLASPEAGHMVRMALTMEDDNHIREEWTFREGGKETVEAFRFTRKK